MAHPESIRATRPKAARPQRLRGEVPTARTPPDSQCGWHAACEFQGSEDNT